MDSVDRLNRRIAVATENDQVLGMFFDSVLRRVGQAAGPAAAEEIRAQVLGRRKQIAFFKYPVSELLQVMRLGAERIHREFTASMEDFGHAAVDDFFNSPVGKTLLTLAGTNVHRVIASAPASYKACATFGRYGYEKLGDTAARLVYEGEFMGPSAQLGVARTVLRMACRIEPELQVSLRDEAGMNFAIEIRW